MTGGPRWMTGSVAPARGSDSQCCRTPGTIPLRFPVDHGLLERRYFPHGA